MCASTAEFNFERQMQLARQGDDSARGRLLEKYQTYLLLLARLEIGRRLQTKADAADLIQETFLEAHRNFRNFRGQTERDFIAWLRAILLAQTALFVRRYVGTQGRNVYREQQLEISSSRSSRIPAAGILSPDSTPSQHAVKQEQGVLLADALDQLPPEYREVIIMRNLEELPLVEIAAAMGRSVNAVQKLWVRALARLREIAKAEAL